MFCEDCLAEMEKYPIKPGTIDGNTKTPLSQKAHAGGADPPPALGTAGSVGCDGRPADRVGDHHKPAGPGHAAAANAAGGAELQHQSDNGRNRKLIVSRETLVSTELIQDVSRETSF